MGSVLSKYGGAQCHLEGEVVYVNAKEIVIEH